MVPTGGVSLDNAAAFLQAGASAIAVGSDLVSKKALDSGDYDQITKLARQFLDVVAQARAPKMPVVEGGKSKAKGRR
jgi:2-dehydro-3-deoxyphosphogluconate aldolase/(4S)-4-hydroxy-2-oxoglutarate aldolase